jgi:5S rRNA maturation endonuclease (ribonuclease M5)
MSTANPVKRFIGSFVCPVCGGAEDDARGESRRCFGFILGNGPWIHCTRPEHAGTAKYHAKSQTYSHRAKGRCPCGVEHAPAEPSPKRKSKRGVIDKVYQYVDENGVPRHETVRFRDPKSFSQRQPEKNGKHVWKLKGVKTILHRLPELIAADPSEPVFIVEGEKDVDRLRSLGKVATCNPMGAGKWRDWYSDVLTKRNVVIIPDNDDDGRQHAQQVAYSLQGKTVSVKVVELSGLPLKGDASDFLDAGGMIDQIDELAAAAPEWTSPSQAASPAPSASQQDKETHSEVLLRLANAATLFHDDSGRAFASVPVGNHYETYDILGSGFRRWLKRQFYLEENRPPSAQSFQDSLGVLEAKAQIDGKSEQVYVRVAEHDSRNYLDLGDDEWRAVEVDATGWRIIDKPPVRFRRPSGLRALPEPARGGVIAKLKDFVNIDVDDFLLLIAVLAAALRVSGPYPILVLTGEQGAAKSTLARIIRRLIDPHVMLLRSEPREPRDLVIGAVNGWVVAMDNLSTMPAWLSDALCRLSTGGGQANRTLYTDSDETFLDAQRPVVLTGITDFVNRGDLIDRCVFLHLPAIAEDKRQTEAKFKASFDAEYPKLLGSLLDAVAGGLRELPNVHLASIPRMADFAVFGEAVSRGLGHPAGKFLEAYRGNRKAANESALEDSYVATAIRELVAKTEWSGTSSELRDELEKNVSEKIAKSDRWPKSPRGMSGVLRRLAPSLRAVGICVEFSDRKTNVRLITISPPVDNKGNQPSSPSSPSSGNVSGDSPGSYKHDGQMTVDSTVIQPSSFKGVTPKGLVSTNDGHDGSDGQNPTLSTEHTDNEREVFTI